jgi:hypothetical protein
MQKYYLNNNNFKKEIVLFLFLYTSLIIGFILGENSTGGAIIDYTNQKFISQKFASDFINTFLNYDSFSSRHSPILIIFLSFFEKINLPDQLIRIIHLHICLILPIIFYKILILKFGVKYRNYLIALVGLVFLSPTFRTLSIWPDSRLLGLIIFSISILYFLKFEKDKNFYYVLLNTLTCALSAYLSPNFFLFSIFFLINYILHYGLLSKKIIIVCIINLILAFPALYYVFILDINFINKSAAIGLTIEDNILFVNFSNNILLTFSIFFFYLIPFVIIKLIKIENLLKSKNLIISSTLLLILIYNFDYNYYYSGGGIFFKISYFLFQNNFLFFFICFFSILFVVALIKEKVLNILLFLLIILNNPQYTIYHKYFDPFILITLFSIFIVYIDITKFKNLKNIIFIYFYFSLFLIMSFAKSVWNI